MKREITVKCTGVPCEEAVRNFHKVLARMIVSQFGVEFAKSLLEKLKKEECGNEKTN